MEQIIDKPLSFEIITPTNNQFANAITFNYEELKNGLITRLSHYESMVYNEDQIKQAKEDRANLNKLKTNIDNERKRIKNEIYKEYEPFNEKVKELINLCDKPINKINDSIKSYETEQKKIKRNNLENYYKSLVEGKVDFININFEKIEISEWSNLSFSMTKAKKAIDERVRQITEDFLTIQTFADYKDVLIDKYIETLDLGEVLREKSRLEQYQETILKEQNRKVCIYPKKEQVNDQVFYKKTFKVSATKEQLVILQNCLLKNNIDFEVI